MKQKQMHNTQYYVREEALYSSVGLVWKMPLKPRKKPKLTQYKLKFCLFVFVLQYSEDSSYVYSFRILSSKGDKK